MNPLETYLITKRGAAKCSGCGKEAELGPEAKCAACSGAKKVAGEVGNFISLLRADPRGDELNEAHRRYTTETKNPLSKMTTADQLRYVQQIRQERGTKTATLSQTDKAKIRTVSKAMTQTKSMSVPQRKEVMRQVGAVIPNQKTAGLRPSYGAFLDELGQIRKLAEGEARPMTSIEKWGPEIWLGDDVPLDPTERQQRYMDNTRKMLPIQAGMGALGGGLMAHGAGARGIGQHAIGAGLGAVATPLMGNALRHIMAKKIYQDALLERAGTR